MYLPASGCSVLIRLIVVQAARQLLGNRVVRRWIIGFNVRGTEVHLSAVRPQQILFLLGLLVLHHTDELVALDRRGHCKSDTGIARRWLNDRVARLEPTVLFGSLDHPEAYAILY